jgi:hypothetical protein
MQEKKFTIGYDVRIVGRVARLVGGLIPLILILMDIFILDNPIPKVAPLVLLRDTLLYLIVVAAVYALLYYLLGDGFLDWLGRVNPWTPTAIFVSPPLIVAALSLGPDAFRLGLGMYVTASAILAGAMSYGGCEVVALAALVFKRRHVVYCPYNIVDVIDDAAVRNAQIRGMKNDPQEDTNSV